MLRIPTLLLVLVASACAGTMLHAQILPAGRGALGSVAGLPGTLVDRLGTATAPIAKSVEALAGERLTRLRSLVRRHPDALEWVGESAAVRGQVTGLDVAPATLAKLSAAGFAVLNEETIEGVGVRTVTLAPPAGWSVRKALDRLRTIAPDATFAPNHVYEPSGRALPLMAGSAALASRSGAPARLAIIDGGVAAHPSLTGPIEQRGFANGAPAASAHGTALASLVAGSASPKGARPGAALLVADVYGKDPAGGNAVAIARAIGWAVARGAAVANVSLVGPPNPLMAATVRAARARGLLVVAPVGNDGPSAPPAYPASYPEVVAVSAVNGRNKALTEAGRALHLDYTAPGADIAAAVLNGRTAPVRGTSFAAPLVAARLLQHYPMPAPDRIVAAVTALDKEARDLGPAGADKIYGRGLICGGCIARR